MSGDYAHKAPRGLLATVNPVARVLGLILMTTPLLISVDWVSAAVALAFSLATAPLSGLSVRQFTARAVPLVVAAPISGISMALYGNPEGREYFSFLLAHVTDNSITLAIAIMLRVLAVGLPVVVLTAGIDPTDLGNGLAQVLRLPSRFVLASVAGMRLIGLFIDDWHALTRARRARGLGDRGKIRRIFSQVFALLVFALRRGAKLATAMEARGFGAPGPRTWWHTSRLRARDVATVVVCALIAVAAIGISVWVGEFRFLGVA
nr:energy-coupling factor transporter transmembrane component T [Corynebacterium lactis]